MACVACVVFPWDGDALGENVSRPGEAGKPSSFTKKFMEQKCVEGKAQCCVVVIGDTFDKAASRPRGLWLSRTISPYEPLGSSAEEKDGSNRGKTTLFGDIQEEAGWEGFTEEGEFLEHRVGFVNKNENYGSFKDREDPFSLGLLLGHHSPGPMGQQHLVKEPGTRRAVALPRGRVLAPRAHSCQREVWGSPGHVAPPSCKEGWEHLPLSRVPRSTSGAQKRTEARVQHGGSELSGTLWNILLTAESVSRFPG